jgi:membrane-bound lytic murein transglycosylase D
MKNKNIFPLLALLASVLTTSLSFADNGKMANEIFVESHTGEDTTFVVPEVDLSQLDKAPRFATEVYKQRLDSLERKIQLDYNNYVQAYIDLYAFRKRDQVERMLGLSEYYFPMIERVFIEQNIPTEFKYLSIVESALNPYAVSPVGATGMWQFMFTTGKMYGLKITSHIDERKDPYKATVAASKYFKDMYARYGDWLLVIAAYNCGPGNVNRAIKRAGGKKNFWAIRPYLPQETRGYVPAYIAATYIMSCAEDHNLYPSYPNFTFENDTISFCRPVSFKDIETQCAITVDELRMLNPMYKKDMIPAFNNESFSILIPATKKDVLSGARDTLYKSFPADMQNDMMFVLNTDPEGRATTTKIHKVRKGETLGRIAAKYNVSVSNIKKWNNLKRNTLLAGQKLKIKKTVPGTAYVQNTPKPSQQAKIILASSTEKQNITNDEVEVVKVQVTKTHTVKRGENLGLIADKYNVYVDDLKKWNSLKSSKLLVGQKLKVKKMEDKVVVKKSSTGNETVALKQNLDISVENEKFVFYKVEPGDTLYSIAKRYDGMTVEKLLQLNGMKSSDALKAGMVLKISTKG